ncbi:MAG: septum formation initiator family protein [bacterium]|nr:septum formation initiator family protein [bacterium]
MQVYQENRRFKKIVFSKPVLGSLFILALFILFEAGRMSWRAWEAREARLKKEAEFQALVAKKQELEKKIENLNDPERAEYQAKEELGIPGEGEEVIIIVEPKNPTSTQTAAASSNKFLEFFRKLFKR